MSNSMLCRGMAKVVATSVCAAALLMLSAGIGFGAEATFNASLSSSGGAVVGASYFDGASPVSADGRFVVFSSAASSIVSGDGNTKKDVFVRDRKTGINERVSVPAGEGESNGESYEGSISADGRYVVFSSQATNLVGGDGNSKPDVFIHDRESDVTERVSVSVNGGDSQGGLAIGSSFPSVSADGRFVAFQSTTTNLVPSDGNGKQDVFVRDREQGITVRVSTNTFGAEVNGESKFPAISDNGTFVAFVSNATDMVSQIDNGNFHVYSRKINTLGPVRCLSSTLNGKGANGNSDSAPSISGDGKYVAFASDASDLTLDDLNTVRDIFLAETADNSRERISIPVQGGQSDGASDDPAISDDGKLVAFSSKATNLIDVGNDNNGKEDIFLRSKGSATTKRISVSTAGVEANQASKLPDISGDGRYVAFESNATNLATPNGILSDVFIRRLVDNTSPTPAFSISSSSGVAPFDITVNAADSSDTDGPPLTYTWDFGDGSSTTGVSATHKYSSPGSFTVTLTVKDPEEASSTTSKTVSVTAASTSSQGPTTTTTTKTTAKPVCLGLSSRRSSYAKTFFLGSKLKTKLTLSTTVGVKPTLRASFAALGSRKARRSLTKRVARTELFVNSKSGGKVTKATFSRIKLRTPALRIGSNTLTLKLKPKKGRKLAKRTLKLDFKVARRSCNQ